MKDNVLIGYVYKYKLFAFGWIVDHEQKKETLYFDNEPFENLKCESRVVFFCVGFSKKGVMEKLNKWAKKRL